MDTNRRQSYRRFLFQHEGHEEICGAKARRVVPPIQNPRRFLRGKGSTEQCDLCISFPCPTFLCPKWTGTFLQNSHCEGQKNPSELFLFLSFFSANRTEEKDQPANLRGAQPFASIRVDSRFESSVLRRSTANGHDRVDCFHRRHRNSRCIRVRKPTARILPCGLAALRLCVSSLGHRNQRKDAETRGRKAVQKVRSQPPRSCSPWRAKEFRNELGRAQPFAWIRVDSRFESSILRRSTANGHDRVDVFHRRHRNSHCIRARKPTARILPCGLAALRLCVSSLGHRNQRKDAETRGRKAVQKVRSQPPRSCSPWRAKEFRNALRRAQPFAWIRGLTFQS
jgi:hypothetical protein